MENGRSVVRVKSEAATAAAAGLNILGAETRSALKLTLDKNSVAAHGRRIRHFADVRNGSKSDIER